MARPKAEIDKVTFEELCEIQCTEAEICTVLRVTDKTLNRWCKETYGLRFSEVFAQKRGLGKVSLRRAGYRMAQENPTVHIFYAKNHLGMKDKIETDNNDVLVKLDEVLNKIGE